MLRITERRIYRRTGSEGPRHDPYSFEEFTIVTNGDTVVVHMGLGDWIEVNGTKVWEGVIFGGHESDKQTRESEAQIFKNVTGLDLAKLERYYYRINPPCRFEDPIGRLSDYI